MSFGGGALALSNFVLFPWLAKRTSAATIFKCSAAALVLVYAAPPVLPRSSAATLPLLLLHNALEKSLSSNCFTAVFLIINASCAPESRGRVNGLGMSVSSGFKAVGPTLGAVCFAWSLTNGLGAPLDVHFTFVLSGLLALLTWYVAWRSFGATPPAATSTAAAPPVAVPPAAPTKEAFRAEAAEGEASSARKGRV